MRAYYSRFREWERLDSPSGALEFQRALSLLDAHVTPNSRVLDLGGGPGRYAVELARRGHRVVIADVSPTLLETARGKVAESAIADRIDSIDEVNATDLGQYASDRFDSVLAFGPFYHLLAAEEREAAAREIGRVLAPGGLAFVAFIPLLSGIAGLIERAATQPEQVPADGMTTTLSGGVFRSGTSTGFQEGYYARPSEILNLFESNGFEGLETVSLRSLANGIEEALAALTGSVAAEAQRIVAEVAHDPAIVATSGHAVLVARKRTA